MKYVYPLLISATLTSFGCYKGKCYQCRKFAPSTNGQGYVYIGTQQVCPEKDNIQLIDPSHNDSTDLWECEE